MYRSNLRERVSAWVSSNVPEGAVSLRPPLDEAACEAVPEGVRALYRFADGQEGRDELFDQYRFLPAAEAREEKEAMDRLATEEGWEEAWWSPRWWPFASDGAGQLLVAEVDGGEVREFFHDDEARPVLAPSAEAFLERFAESLESGERVWDDEHRIIEAAERDRIRAQRAQTKVAVQAAEARGKKLVAALIVGGLLAFIALVVLLECSRG